MLIFFSSHFTSSFGPLESLVKALFDNSCHQIMSLICWCMFEVCSAQTTIFECDNDWKNPIWGVSSSNCDRLLACSIASLIDLDHFITAAIYRGSVSLHSATHLKSRPFCHCIVTVAAIIVLVHLRWRNSRITYIILVATFGHLLRDSCRRGIWFIADLSTPPIPYPWYLFLMAAIPITIGTINRAKTVKAENCIY